MNIAFPGMVGSIAICEVCKKRTWVFSIRVEVELVHDESDDLSYNPV